jgi:hypothetical protein
VGSGSRTEGLGKGRGSLASSAARERTPAATITVASARLSLWMRRPRESLVTEVHPVAREIKDKKNPALMNSILCPIHADSMS